jgi:hypothetical protein
MKYIVSAAGFVIFGGVALIHFFGLYRVVTLLRPNLQALAGFCLALFWLAAVGTLLWGIRRNQLRLCFGLVFAYMMFILLAGTQVLKGVPMRVEEGTWRDPHRLLTPEARYVLHNHGVVNKVLSREEYDLYSFYALCYFTSAGMMMGSALCVIPLDRDDQLGFWKKKTAWGTAGLPPYEPAPGTAPCAHCGWRVPAEAPGHWPPWCPHCGATFTAEPDFDPSR